MLKKFLLLSTLMTTTAQAAPYVELKDEYTWNDSKRTDHLRFGYKWSNVYAEIGPMTSGTSWETGFSFKVGSNLSWKTKLEVKDPAEGSPKSKIETKIRYTFQ